jgi:predicted CoA-binding protein
MVIDQIVVMTVAQVLIDQQVVHTVIVIQDHHHDQALIDQRVVHTVTEIHVQVPIVHVVKIRTVAIAHAQAMTATRAHLRVIANAVADQIVPAVDSPMIAKSVHAAALAKSA